MFLAGEGNGMTTTERWTAALLLGLAVAGGASIPRLLSPPASPHGVGLVAAPGTIVVEAPAPAKPRRQTVPLAAPAARATAPPVVPVVEHAAPRPRPQPAKRVVARPAPLPARSSPSAPPPTPAPTSLAAPPAAAPTALAAREESERQNPPTGRGRDLRGFRHGKEVRQASPHALGAHDRGVGHLASPPTGAAKAAHAGSPEARPEDRGRGSGHGTPPTQAIAHGHGR
jgi:hypothetical protein